MSTENPEPKPQPSQSSAAQTCQVCGKVGAVIYEPEKAPPNRMCYRCAAEYGLQDSDDE